MNLLPTSVSHSCFPQYTIEKLTISYRTNREYTLAITAWCRFNEDERFETNGKRLAEAVIKQLAKEPIPVGYCLAFWGKLDFYVGHCPTYIMPCTDAEGHFSILAEKLRSRKWACRMSKNDIILLNVPKIKAMLLSWSQVSQRGHLTKVPSLMFIYSFRIVSI